MSVNTVPKAEKSGPINPSQGVLGWLYFII